ncbi:MAG: hypothetical protein HWN66_04090 [Candidatus Helarchaeota archaeon]|nr:hypothetical protein [Candidatus Helarchaeota archaeon]
MSLEKPNINFKLKALLASKTKEDLLKIIKNYNEYCKANDLQENMLKGYSKKPYNTKEGLIDFLNERLSDEEKEGIINKIEKSYLEDLFKLAEGYVKDKNDREKLETIDFLKNGLKLKFKGWQWENEIEIELAADGTLTNYTCTCRTGKMDGFCPHLFTGILILVKERKYNPDKFVFKFPESSLKLIQQLKVDIKKFESIDSQSADIVLGDDYFISVNGDLVTMKWGGDRAGKTTKDITKEKKPIAVELWVAKKVVDKILAPLRAHPQPREVFKDDFGVIPIILENENLVEKLLKKFIAKNEEADTNLPSTQEELEQFLTANI